MNPTVLDPCCGSRMMWFDKQDQRVLFGDQRTESHVLSDGRALEIKPDVKLDFTNLPFAATSFLAYPLSRKTRTADKAKPRHQLRLPGVG